MQRDSLFNLDIFKNNMSSKSKKKLTFLTTEKRNKLKQRIISENQAYAKEFKQHFCNSYQSYLDHYPEKKELFFIGMEMNYFIMLTELLLLHICDIFSDCEKKANKYAQFQMCWYNFSGKILNECTGVSAIDDILCRYFENLRQAHTSNDTEGDIRIYLSCILKSLQDFFLHISYKIKSSCHVETRPRKSNVTIDDTSAYRIAGSNLQRMIKKRKSAKFLKRLTKKKQAMIQLELCLLQNLHYSEQEKQKTEIPFGIQHLDRGNLIIVKKPILNFVKVIIKNVCGNVNKESYQHLGAKMTQVAKLKVSDRETKSMFCACVKLAAGNVSLDKHSLQLLCLEYSTKIFNTLINEYIKRDKFIQKNTAQLMLRDKLKYFATQPKCKKTSKKK